MNGGHDGSYNYFMIIKKDGTKERHSLATNIFLEKGDIVRCVTAHRRRLWRPRPKTERKGAGRCEEWIYHPSASGGVL